jgi:hypothetical protein
MTAKLVKQYHVYKKYSKQMTSIGKAEKVVERGIEGMIAVCDQMEITMLDFEAKY